MYIYIYIYILYMCIYTHICILHLCIHTHLDTCTSIHAYISCISYTYIYTCNIYTHVYIYVYTCIHTHVDTYKCTHIHMYMIQMSSPRCNRPQQAHKIDVSTSSEHRRDGWKLCRDWNRKSIEGEALLLHLPPTSCIRKW